MMLLALLLSYMIAGVSSLHIKELQVPKSIEAGQVVRLECTFDLEQEELYLMRWLFEHEELHSVKWYKDGIEFFRFDPKDRSANKFFQIRGFEVDDMSFSSYDGVLLFLKNTSRSAEGMYRCEVSTEAPLLRTAFSEKFMAVEDEAGKSALAPGSLACSDDHCKDPALEHFLMKVKYLPNKFELRFLCPRLIAFLECERGFLECPGRSLDELATSSDKTESTKANGMMGALSLVRDLCDEDSSFHHDYIESFYCFKGYVLAATTKCRYDARKPIEGFFGGMYTVGDGFGEEALAEIQCLRDAFELACIVENFGNSCGSVAQRTAVTALKRLNTFLKAEICADVKDAADLKSRFLDFLELDERRRSNYQEIFDVVKKRR